MKRILATSLFIQIILLAHPAQAINYYFSTSSGNDSRTVVQAKNPATPWKTIEKLNQIFNLLAPGDKIFFKRGETFSGTIMVTISGTSSLPIVFGAYGSGSNPVISGGVILSSWTNDGNGIYSALLSNAPNVVTINGVQYGPGRYPNSGWLTIDKTDGTYITNKSLRDQEVLTGGKAVIRMNRFIIEKNDITAHSGSTIDIRTSSYHPERGFGFFITNNLSTLNKYGEWVYEEGKLKIYSGRSAPANVIVSSLSNVVNLSGQSNITFNDIDFAYANNEIIKIDNSSAISFNHCGIRYGVTGILVTGAVCKNFNVSNCAISYINMEGITMYGDNNDSLIIHENSFKNIAMIPGEGGVNDYEAISLENANSTNGNISNNRIDSVGYCGISGIGQGTTIKNNYITNTCQLVDDGGGIYVQRAEGTNKRITGNIIINNGNNAGIGTPDPTSNQAYGIYSDAGNTNTEVDSNTISGFGAGIYMDDSQGMNFHHNTVFNNSRGIEIEYLGHNPISGLNVSDNIAINPDEDSRVISIVRQDCGSSSIEEWGTINNNHWARPLNDDQIIYSGNCNGSRFRSLAQWASSTGHDKNSAKLSVTVSDASQIRFEYNASNVAKVINLPAKYVDIKNQSYSGEITLAPYSSVVLMRPDSGQAHRHTIATANSDKNQSEKNKSKSYFKIALLAAPFLIAVVTWFYFRRKKILYEKKPDR